MIQVQTVEDLYPALDELVVELKAMGHSRLAATIHHRMHRVAWTTRSELFDELRKVLSKAMQSEDTSLPQPFKDQTERILRVLDGCLNSGA